MYRRRATRRPRAALIFPGLVRILGAGMLGVSSIAHAQHKLPVRPPAAAAVTQQPDGKKIFTTTCAVCHQLSGEGVEEKYPPLVQSEWVGGDDGRLVRIILHGLTGPVEVAGQSYSGAMPPWGGLLKDPELAAVVSYIRSAWGNKGAPVTVAKVAGIRAATSTRKVPWTADELSRLVIPIRKE